MTQNPHAKNALQVSKLASAEVDAMQKSSRPPLLPGIEGLDDMMYGLRSNICTIHGNTNHGKTVLAEIITANNMPKLEENEVVVKCLLEDALEEMAIREASTLTQPFLSVSDITSGKMTPEQLKNFKLSLNKLGTRPIWHIGNSRQDYQKSTLATVPQIKDAVDWIANTQGKKIKLIVVDYFQRIKPHSKGRRDDLLYGEMVDMLDYIALGYNCPLLLLSQSSREAAKQRRIPVETDMKQTGKLEEAARTVLVVYRPHIQYSIGSEWDYFGTPVPITDDKLICIGIQKQKYKQAPRYRLFRTNERKHLTRVDLKNIKLN